MIVGILVKTKFLNKEIHIRKTFKDSDSLMEYWKEVRENYPKANFFAYRCTNPNIEGIYYKYKDSVLYCPYCECKRRFLIKKNLRRCEVCDISFNSNVKLCNWRDDK